MKSANVRTTTLNDYTYKVKKFIIAPLGHKYMADVTPDDIKVTILLASQKSESIYRSVQMLYKSIFDSAVESNVIEKSPCEKLSAKGGKPQKKREALTDSQHRFSVKRQHTTEKLCIASTSQLLLISYVTPI